MRRFLRYHIAGQTTWVDGMSRYLCGVKIKNYYNFYIAHKIEAVTCKRCLKKWEGLRRDKN